LLFSAQRIIVSEKSAHRMRFAYYDRLSPASKEVYRRSDAIETLELPAGIRRRGAGDSHP
jgi:hypothetical protein